MDKLNNHPKQFFLKNTFKSFTVLIIGSLLFVTIITIFPLIGSLTMDDFPIEQVVKDNFKLLIPLLIVNILISPLLGRASSKLRKKRFLYLFLIGIGGCWLTIIFVLLMWANFTIVSDDIGPFILMSIWGLFAYSFFSLPILIPAILIIEKWTRFSN